VGTNILNDDPHGVGLETFEAAGALSGLALEKYRRLLAKLGQMSAHLSVSGPRAGGPGKSSRREDTCYSLNAALRNVSPQLW
jgi:hypothetical protein